MLLTATQQMINITYERKRERKMKKLLSVFLVCLFILSTIPSVSVASNLTKKDNVVPLRVEVCPGCGLGDVVSFVGSWGPWLFSPAHESRPCSHDPSALDLLQYRYREYGERCTYCHAIIFQNAEIQFRYLCTHSKQN